jgi:peptide/nickel transport system substrate-binding protein
MTHGDTRPWTGAATRREALKRFGVLGAGAALGGTLVRSAPAALSRLEAPPTTLRWAISLQPASLDIATNYYADTNTVGGLVNEPLLMLDPNGRLIPWLAASWSNPSPLRYVYKLRRGVKFSDGSPLTADDVAYSLGRHLEKALGSQIGTFYTSVRSVKATGHDEVTVFLKRPDISVASTVPVVTLIVKRSVAQPLGKGYARPGGKMVGTGPFLLDSYTSTGISLSRNPGYWGRRPPVEHVHFSYISDPQTVQLAVASGGIDGTFIVPPTLAKQYKQSPGVAVQGSLGLMYFVTFDTSKPPFDDVHVRRAVAHCWDGPGFVKGTLRGLGEVADGVVFPWQWASVQSPAQTTAFYKSLPKYPYSIDAAKAELKKSKHPNGFSLSTVYNSGFPNEGLALQALTANLSQIGIHVTVKELPTSAWLNMFYAHENLNLYPAAFGPDYVDPNDFLEQLLDSKQAVKNGVNIANYRNPRADRLLAIEQGTTNKARRRAALQQLYRTAQTDLPYLALWYEDLLMAIRKPFVYRGFSAMYFYTPWIYNIRVA